MRSIVEKTLRVRSDLTRGIRRYPATSHRAPRRPSPMLGQAGGWFPELDGYLPYPYGREITGYSDLSETLSKARAAGATVLVAPYTAAQRQAAMVEFPGGYIAEIHSSGRN